MTTKSEFLKMSHQIFLKFYIWKFFDKPLTYGKKFSLNLRNRFFLTLLLQFEIKPPLKQIHPENSFFDIRSKKFLWIEESFVDSKKCYLM